MTKVLFVSGAAKYEYQWWQLPRKCASAEQDNLTSSTQLLLFCASGLGRPAAAAAVSCRLHGKTGKRRWRGNTNKLQLQPQETAVRLWCSLPTSRDELLPERPGDRGLPVRPGGRRHRGPPVGQHRQHHQHAHHRPGGAGPRRAAALHSQLDAVTVLCPCQCTTETDFYLRTVAELCRPCAAMCTDNGKYSCAV